MYFSVFTFCLEFHYMILFAFNWSCFFFLFFSFSIFFFSFYFLSRISCIFHFHSSLGFTPPQCFHLFFFLLLHHFPSSYAFLYPLLLFSFLGMSDMSDFAIYPLFLARVLLSIFLLRLLPFLPVFSHLHLVFSHLHLVLLLFQFLLSRAIFTHFFTFRFNIFSFLFFLLPAYFIRFLVVLCVLIQSILFVIFFSIIFLPYPIFLWPPLFSISFSSLFFLSFSRLFLFFASCLFYLFHFAFITFPFCFFFHIIHSCSFSFVFPQLFSPLSSLNDFSLSLPPANAYYYFFCT